MATSVSASAQLALPGSTGLTAQSIPFTFSGTYTSKTELDITLTGTGTYVVPFAGVTKARVVVVHHVAPESGTPEVVALRLNGSTDDSIELSPGGWSFSVNPVPDTGVTALSIVHTTDVRVLIWLLE